VLKLFEIIILERCSDVINHQLSIQQGGFQPGLCYIMTSFALRESFLYGRENSSKVYLCYLDVKQAFDHVWHPGLLHKLGVDDTALLALRAMYKGSLSQERYQDQLSETFTVQQGTKQGGKSSPLTYLVYIDGIIKELEASGYGMCIYDHNICSLTVVDDMVLVSLSKSSMDAMLNICWEYSRKWRFCLQRRQVQDSRV